MYDPETLRGYEHAHLIFHTDGACSMKRNVAAGAAVAFKPDGTELGYRARFLRYATTPIAEYTGLIVALEIASVHAYEATIYMDAELIARQVTGAYACRNALLQPLLAHALELGSQIPRVRVLEFPKGGPEMKRRHSNARADSIANECREAGHDIWDGIGHAG